MESISFTQKKVKYLFEPITHYQFQDKYFSNSYHYRSLRHTHLKKKDLICITSPLTFLTQLKMEMAVMSE